MYSALVHTAHVENVRAIYVRDVYENMVMQRQMAHIIGAHKYINIFFFDSALHIYVLQIYKEWPDQWIQLSKVLEARVDDI